MAIDRAAILHAHGLIQGHVRRTPFSFAQGRDFGVAADALKSCGDTRCSNRQAVED
jgi:hypothetical protein